ncbi:MAG: RNA methyltransferase [Bdellovibrionia bacterium]
MNWLWKSDSPLDLVFDSVYIALLHYPIQNRNGALVTTAVTNMDVHDISRSARTYGMKGYFIVTPIEDQHGLIGRILGHWKTDESRKEHPDRVEALSLVQLVRSFEDVKASIRSLHGEDPEVVLTDARPLPHSVSYDEYRAELKARPSSGKPVVLVFGTGWGISEVFYPEVHRILAPVYGPGGFGGYNHLSVRSAVAIILDRLFGT